MSAAVPVQYLADMVVLICDAATGDPALAVIIEPQPRGSDTKRYSWSVYVTTARRTAKCAGVPASGRLTTTIAEGSAVGLSWRMCDRTAAGGQLVV